jgi:hypothetical protein
VRVLAAFLASILVFMSLGQGKLSQWKLMQCQGSPVSNRYFNYAEGFSVAIPTGLQGRRGQSAGPERGVAIPLTNNCTAVVVVFGQPNSLEWLSSEDAITWEIRTLTDGDLQAEVQRYATHLGDLKAAGVTVRHRATSDVEDIVVAFRAGGPSVYMAWLATTHARYKQDHDSFAKVLAGFRLEVRR